MQAEQVVTMLQVLIAVLDQQWDAIMLGYSVGSTVPCCNAVEAG